MSKVAGLLRLPVGPDTDWAWTDEHMFRKLQDDIRRLEEYAPEHTEYIRMKKDMLTLHIKAMIKYNPKEAYELKIIPGYEYAIRDPEHSGHEQYLALLAYLDNNTDYPPVEIYTGVGDHIFPEDLVTYCLTMSQEDIEQDPEAVKASLEGEGKHWFTFMGVSFSNFSSLQKRETKEERLMMAFIERIAGFGDSIISQRKEYDEIRFRIKRGDFNGLYWGILK